MNKNNAIKALAALFFAVIFIISYSTVFNFGSPAGTTTVASRPATVYAFAYSNAIVSEYTPVLNISVKCPDAAESIGVSAEISNAISALEANNSVRTFYSVSSHISLDAGNSNTIQIYNYIYSHLNASGEACAAFSSGALFLLPKVINFTVKTQTVQVVLQNSTRRFIAPINLTHNASLVAGVRIAAFLTQNATVYGNLSITRV